MKNKMKAFAKGEFPISKPEVYFSDTFLDICVGEGEIYNGSFTIQNQKEGNIRGLVYTSSSRIQFSEQGFEGNPVEIHFTYDSTGMEAGQTEESTITVVCNGGEFSVHVAAMVEKPFMMTEYGKIQNVRDLKMLAKKDFIEARRLFRSKQFCEILKYEDPRVRNLYMNMRKWALDEQALEEFLVGLNLKEKVKLSLSYHLREQEDLLDSRKEWLEITKNTWGYLPITIESDAEFLEVSQKIISTDDFVGSTYRMEYMIRASRLHAGMNYGRLIIRTPYETQCVEIRILQHTHTDPGFGVKGLVAGQGLKEYLAFISGNMQKTEWVEKAEQRIRQLRNLDANNEYYILLHAHILLRAGRDDEAKWILEHHNFGNFVIGRKLEISAYYMFLKALLREDSVYTNRVAEELHRLYTKKPQSWPLLCMLLHTDHRYRSYGERLKMLEQQYEQGGNQVLFYAECYLCFQENVLLLRKLGEFEIQILNFATKYKMITRELAIHAAELIGQQKHYNKTLVRILERAYNMYEEPQILTAICMQLIKGNQSGSEYFHWFEKAVQKELKIVQLYEYYLMSVRPSRVKKAFPRMVYLYFMHGVQLDYKRTALLYANIVTYESDNEEIFRSYREKIKAFTLEQLQKRRIDDALCVLYRRFLREDELQTEQMEALYDICHSYKVKACNDQMKYVMVIEKDGSLNQRVACQKEGAIIYLYDKDARIVWEARDGVHYTGSVTSDVRRLFFERQYGELCKKIRKQREAVQEQVQQLPLTLEHVRQYGIDQFDEKEVFLMCTRRVREQAYEEEDQTLALSFELLKRGQYDKALLTYLTRFYCGATKDMKFIFHKAKEYGVQTHEIGERILTQMLYAETLFGETEIFEDYYQNKPYFRLKQAFLSYVSREYVVENRRMDGTIIEILLREYEEHEYMADVCKAAVLKYYAEHPYDAEIEESLHEMLIELCKKQMILPYYLCYPRLWLEEVQLQDKILIEYQAKDVDSVTLFYQIHPDGSEMGEYESAILQPVYGSIYVKPWILYEGEQVTYFFREVTQEGTKDSPVQSVKRVKPVEGIGKFERLNQMSRLHGEMQREAVRLYQQEELLADQIFTVY